MKRALFAAIAVVVLALVFAWAHETRTVGEGDEQYQVTVGMLNEPVFTELRTGLDLAVRTMNDEPVENLENSLTVEITAPDGTTKRTLTLRGQFNRPGYYTDDYILTQPGTYQVRVYGFIGGLEINETFDREVGDVADLRFP